MGGLSHGGGGDAQIIRPCQDRGRGWRMSAIHCPIIRTLKISPIMVGYTIEDKALACLYNYGRIYP